MVDTQLLDERISASGKKKSYLADQLGITVQTLRRKIKNEFSFTTDEVTGLCDELDITDMSDMQLIFFKRNVENTST